MFDKLVESTKSKQRGRSGRLFFLTGLIYATLLGTLAIWTIFGFSPGLAEELSMAAHLVPPPPPVGPPPPPQLTRTPPRPTPSNIFAPPTGEREVPPPTTVPPLEPHTANPCPGCLPLARDVPGPGWGSGPGVPNGIPNGAPVPPPPPPRPTPTPEPAPEVKPTPRTPTKVSEGVVQGLAIRRVSPQYPPIAKAGRISGPVQVQILISEEGRVLSTEVLSGHPLLRQAALDAARQWVFRPTLLSQVPVKVQGVLTFNFTLN